MTKRKYWKKRNSGYRLWIRMLLNLIYPRRCPVCHRILKKQRRLVCAECEQIFLPVTGSRCMKCSKPVKEEEELCRECAQTKRMFTQGQGVYIYDEKIRQSLIYYKYFGRREYGDYFALQVSLRSEKLVRRWKPDVIIPIPLHKRKLKKRGFNQSAYLAERIGAYYHIPVAYDVLEKVKHTRAQKKLDARARRSNLQKAFAVRCPVDGCKVLLVDDIYTTGSTLDAAAACLREMGAEQVYFLTIALGQC